LRAASTASSFAAPPHIAPLITRPAAFCFDVDSTVITTEGIDELAAFANKKAEVAALTARAMGGAMPFHEALEARLSIIRPSATLVADFLSRHPHKLTFGVRELVATLHARGTHVFLVSGGFTQMIFPVAQELAIPRERVFANTLLFGEDGAYAGFDTSAPTCRDGGKAEVMRRLKERFGGGGIVMVGDGATDLQAKPPADCVIGYGGVVARAAVKEKADWFVTCHTHIHKAITGAAAALL
jgi:phosphoserine phosphatase